MLDEPLAGTIGRARSQALGDLRHRSRHGIPTSSPSCTGTWVVDRKANDAWREAREPR